jgi:hypothetical protein
MIVRLGGLIVRKRCGEFFRAGACRVRGWENVMGPGRAIARG